MGQTKWETNPFAVFSPPKSKYLILGSFAAKDSKSGHSYDWYYSNGRNQFWPILERIYGGKLTRKEAQQKLFADLSIAIADIIYQCERVGNSSLDVNLQRLIYNHDPIAEVLRNNPIQQILFTSRFVETRFKKHFKDLIEEFPQVELVTLPSPSPRYASMRLEEKIKIYTHHFPKA